MTRLWLLVISHHIIYLNTFVFVGTDRGFGQCDSLGQLKFCYLSDGFKLACLKKIIRTVSHMIDTIVSLLSVSILCL